MTTFNQGARVSDVLAWEPNALYCREMVTVASGNNLVIGAVLGRITASGKVVPLAPGASDGSEAAYGVLLENVNATAGDATGQAIVRLGMVKTEGLVWGGAVTGGQKTTAIAQLVAKGIVARAAV